MAYFSKKESSDMIRFLVLCVILGSFLVFSIPILVVEYFLGKKYPDLRDRSSLAIVKFMFRLFLAVAGVHITVKGFENIPDDRAVLYVGNHRSYFDILVGYVTVPTLMGFIAKKEMKRYPSLSQWMENVHCLFLDRDDIREGLKTILQGIEQVKSGISVWIFPEGTRNRNEDILDMLPFKEGSLKIAEKAKSPVIPVAITGTAEIFETHIPAVKPAKVTIEFGEPFYIGDLTKEEKKFAGVYTQNKILEMLRKEKESRMA